MPNIEDGGPAFPVLNERHVGEVGRTDSTPGMSLRDYFAGQALTSIAQEYTIEDAAKHSYRYADAMLAERSKERS